MYVIRVSEKKKSIEFLIYATLFLYWFNAIVI